MIRKPNSNVARLKRHRRMRKNLVGTTARPRLNVFRSLNHMYAQIIDDTTGRTLASASTLDKEIKDNGAYTGNKDAAKQVGILVAKRALEKGISKVVFDRGGYIYHGRVESLASGAREAGLEF